MRTATATRTHPWRAARRGRRAPARWASVLVISGGLVAALALPATPIAGSAQPEGAAAAAGPLAVYVSTSGIGHNDLADVATLRAGLGWDPGDPNSINSDWTAALDTVWNQVASEHPDAVFATGDMVGGFWGVDPDHTGIFGPVDTLPHRAQAVVNAGMAYEGAVRDEFRSHGLAVYPGLGDHEIGGFSHSGLVGPDAFVARAHWAWVAAWTRTFHHRPYYHVTLPGSVELWTLAPFRVRADGGLASAIGPGQLRWLARTLDDSTARWKIVQTEIPPYSSPGFHGWNTSETHLRNADEVYRTLAHGGVDLVLAAEFHAVDALQKRGVPEIIHGGALASGRVNYLTIDVYRSVLRITESWMAPGVVDRTTTLWGPSQTRRPPERITMTPGATVSGHMTVTHAGATFADGDLTLH